MNRAESWISIWELATALGGLLLICVSYLSNVGYPLAISVGTIVSVLGIRLYTLITKGITERKESNHDFILSGFLVLLKISVILFIVITIINKSGSGSLLFSFLGGLLTFYPGLFIAMIWSRR